MPRVSTQLHRYMLTQTEISRIKTNKEADLRNKNVHTVWKKRRQASYSQYRTRVYDVIKVLWFAAIFLLATVTPVDQFRPNKDVHTRS